MFYYQSVLTIVEYALQRSDMEIVSSKNIFVSVIFTVIKKNVIPKHQLKYIKTVVLSERFYFPHTGKSSVFLIFGEEKI